MHYFLPAAVFLLMVSVGMSLKLKQVFTHWRQLNLIAWLSLLTATFLIPPALALLLANLFHFDLGETAGLFMVGVAPGAPLLTRNIAKKGFDMQLAASYQVWAALMIPIVLPIVVALAAKLYDREVWIPPIDLLKQIVEKQFLPLAVGMIFYWLAPKLAQTLQPILNVLGNVLLTVMIAAILFKMGPALKQISPLIAVAALVLAIGSIAAIRVLKFNDALAQQTFAICNANRHVGLALLLTGQYGHAEHGLPAVACYALAAPLTMFAYVKLFPARSNSPRL
jgi:BASS family bile acid:Na+ symporter